MDNNIQIYSAMQEDKPIRTWIKTILGKVYIVAWDDMTDQPTGLLLNGDPKKLEENSLIKIWSTKGDIFFKNMNRLLISRGILKEVEPEKLIPEKTDEDLTDTELLEITSMKHLALKARIAKIKTAPVLFRMVNIARDNEKADSVIKAIELRLSEIQAEITE